MLPVSEYAEVRPRTMGEILDDGWRLYLADIPLLLALSGLFLVPTAAAILMLLTQPPGPGAAALLWPAVTALLLPLTGLGSGACQEAFHFWAEGEPPTVRQCLRAALKRGLNHTTAQLLALMLPVAAFAWLLLPDLPAWARGLGAPVILLLGLPVWLLGITRHAVLTAGQKNLWKAWRHSNRASGRNPGKALVILVTRVVLLAFAVLNLHLFGQFALWAAEALGGFDVALVRLLCSLGNPAYAVALLALAWWLLMPYLEAVNYLFYVDARTRYEGLDLWYRVEEFFPVPNKSRAGAWLLAAGAALLAPGVVQADTRLDTVRAARQAITQITDEVRAADPYPGGQRWEEPLRAVGRRLDPTGTAERGRFRWFFKAIENFGKADRAQAVDSLEAIAARLAAIEDGLARLARKRDPGEADNGPPSKEHIKSLVPPAAADEGATKKAREKVVKKGDDIKEKDVNKDNGRFEDQPFRRGGPAVVGPVGLGGLAHLLLVVLIALAVAVVAVGVALAVRSWLQNRPTVSARREGMTPPSPADFLDEPDRQNVASLWRESDELARAGRFLDAVRTLYLAVLALLHQAALIRYERTRTNGEYADQLRPRVALHAPFVQLTGTFEIKWYGERACHEADYAACRAFAEDIRGRSSQEPVSP
jgi:hypothetical protein